MASITSGGMFRHSKNLRSKSKGEPGIKHLPPPVSSEQYKKIDQEISTYSDVPSSSANGAHGSKEEDHYGFLYSVSEKELH